MGNYISCSLSTPMGRHSSSRGTKVILPNGEIRQLNQPIKAAELMLDTPNHFLVNSKALQIGRRFSALNADEDLEMGVVYAMFPMKRVNSFVNAADLGPLFVTANSAAKRGSIGSVRISPECGDQGDDEEWVPVSTLKLNLDDVEEFSLPEFKHRLSMCRSKKPLLETIAEESACSR